ncbi:MarR family winged helix-turn-helix transcriptional regulator [Mucilaginibacter sp. X4EP1]|uniref:MarR family winged helix-turn-helix transcriptional regulator n=1 Tax=Mucilaginibacter sp. X4EP1 TaxID=2723092 RepID=UPI002166FCC5|nr:MarR family transcriptional regulator [Mucilaginibacter sp. X4EP1]MCS3815971.1 DNA-binding MarR family transcriptional regulator [Mucilaginibacter sp. X4EP1]
MDYLKLEDQACFPVYALSRVLTAHYKPILEGIELTYPQYLVMLILWEHQQLSVKEIGEKLLLDSGTLTPLLKKLEARKLVSRNRSSEDERVVMIKLTEDGAALKEKARAIPESFKCSLGLTIEEMVALRDSIKLILERTKQINK